MIYAVTGSSGEFGRLAIQHLLNLTIPPSSIIALARNEAKTTGLKALGVQVRIADYSDKTALAKALAGVDRLILVSSSEVGQRAIQHQNVIDAAKEAGVGYLVYTSIAHADTSTNVLAPEHRLTEEAIRSSGIPFTILRNNWYTENYRNDLAYAKESGIIAAAVRTGKVASASRTDYAEAAARVLAGGGHQGKVYELSGSKAWNFSDLAQAASEVLGRTVVFKSLGPNDRKASLIAAGLDQGTADFVLALDNGTEAGTLALASKDLEGLLGREPLGLKEGLRAFGL